MYERPFNETTCLYALLLGGSYILTPAPMRTARGLPCGSAFPSIVNSIIVILSILPVYFLCYDMAVAFNLAEASYFSFGNFQRQGKVPTSSIRWCNFNISGLRTSY